MNHLSFYWLPENGELLIKGIESEFSTLIEHSIKSRTISLPPISDVVLKIQQLCTQDTTTVSDVADSLLEDPGLAAIVIRVANSVIFNRRNITCTDLVTAVSRLGILRVRDIVTAQAIEQLKHSVNLSQSCNQVLVQSAMNSRELAATMVLVVRGFKESGSPSYNHLETDKALLTGLLADIGLFCIVNEYHNYLEQGNYLNEEIAFQIFDRQCSNASKLVLESWGFDNDFLAVACNQVIDRTDVSVSYLDVARIANHILMFRRQDEQITEHTVEFDITGADILYKLSNLSDIEFNTQIDELISASGL
ncbi:HDOD domain-containing protein [Vibrio europaeus]|uniref:HDOD domain-containing protein n=1 Tax=Vibrio europaeus TaxID=300876 RepID=UPI00233F6B38|nr:HDOD domain-containing protein [Vibrio europaeus]MDC5821411.1 HDOD domain-containing protein [Vibrio europaeus]MDC5868409.1 HDOD domain-containing protein [Vibrio europaeus]